MKLQKEKSELVEIDQLSLANVFDVTRQQEAALIFLGYTLYSQGRLEDARKIMEGVTALNDGISFSFGLLGAIYQKKAEYDLAVERYTTALTINPDDTYCLVNRAEILLRQGKFQEALTDLTKAIEADPDKKHPAANRARLLVALAQDAVKELALEQQPT